MTRSWTSWRPALRPRWLSHRSARTVLQGVYQEVRAKMWAQYGSCPGLAFWHGALQTMPRWQDCRVFAGPGRWNGMQVRLYMRPGSTFTRPCGFYIAISATLVGSHQGKQMD